MRLESCSFASSSSSATSNEISAASPLGTPSLREGWIQLSCQLRRCLQLIDADHKYRSGKIVTGRCWVGPAVLADSPDLGRGGTRPYRRAGGHCPPPLLDPVKDRSDQVQDPC